MYWRVHFIFYSLEKLMSAYCDRKKKSGFPLRLENLEKWESIFQSGKSQGILNRLEKSGKMIQNTLKMRKFQTNVTGSNLLCKQHIILNHVLFRYESSGRKM